MNKKIYLFASLFLCTSCSITNLFTPNAKILKEPSKFRTVIKGAAFDELAQNVRDFSADFCFETNKKIDDRNANYAVSPLSMYSTLAVASACASGNTQQELLSALKTNKELLNEQFANLYSASNDLLIYGGNTKQIIKKEELTNSLWLDKNVTFKKEQLDFLAEKFYSYSVQVDYANHNKQANKQMSKFVEEKTNGLLNPEFNFAAQTVLTILNTLYLKTLWYDTSDDISLDSENTQFKNRDNSINNKRLFTTYYQTGRILKTEKYSSFFAQTSAGDRIKFIVPNDGVNLEDVITPETFLEIANHKYSGFDEENNTMYYGRTHFPGFEAKCELEAKGIIRSLGVNDFFVDGLCDFSPLTDLSVYCDSIIHATKLKVEEKGIEGAAYTAIAMEGESASIEPEYKKVYEDFIVDRAFYYIVSDHNNLPVFSGVVNKI